MDTIKIGSVKCMVDRGRLHRVENETDEKVSFSTASLQTDSEKITSIAPMSFIGPFKKIILDDNIQSVGEYALGSVVVDEVVWSPKCYRIPDGCFANASLEKISNISEVTEICTGAFSYSCISEFIWPSACNIIPDRCFEYSNLRAISGIENVVEIQEGAFALTHLRSLDLSALCIRDIGHGAFAGMDKSSVTFPYYFGSTDYDKFFISQE